MLLVSYDISDDKKRTRFSKFLEQFGYRLQYSLFEIKNSKRVLKLIEIEIEARFKKEFKQTDSVIIFNLSKQCKVSKYGYADHDEELIIF